MFTLRREFLYRLVAAGIFAGSSVSAAPLRKTMSPDSKQSEPREDVRAFFSKLAYTRQDVDDWLAERRFPFNRYDAELGYLLRNARFHDGIARSTSTYTYSGRGERKMINYVDHPCRINTYGDSFTECHQVSDGETWQEVLAAHFGEPIRNFGIGGYSVYQAYLRMLREEERTPASYIIFNIFLDDHIRTLVPFQAIRFRKIEAAFRPSQPYMTVNLATGECTPQPNPCPTEESLYNLCDVDWLIENFANSLTTRWVTGSLEQEQRHPESSYKAVIDLNTTREVSPSQDLSERLHLEAEEIVRRAGMIASMRIVEWVEDYARENDKKLLYVLSHPGRTAVIKYLQTKERWDQPFVEFLKKKGVPVVDMMEAHESDYARFKGTPEDYIERYFVGHYNPQGNFFQAFALREKLVELLDPKPPAYQTMVR